MNYNYTVVFPFEDNFEVNKQMKWMDKNWIHSITISTVYVLAIYIGQKIMSHQKAFALDKPLFYWNSLLATFSIVGLLRMTPEFFYSVSKGFQYSICNMTNTYGVSEFWTYAFVMSKAFELIDTAFIVLRKRPLTFLHVYHHITVFIYVWYGYKDITASGRWFMWMNYGVHSIMYTYYACRSVNVKFSAFLPMTITTLQLTQMVVGCYVNMSVYFTKLKGENCQQTYESLYFCFFIYFTYFLLFAKFFYTTYIAKGNRYATGKSKKIEWMIYWFVGRIKFFGFCCCFFLLKLN